MNIANLELIINEAFYAEQVKYYNMIMNLIQFRQNVILTFLTVKVYTLTARSSLVSSILVYLPHSWISLVVSKEGVGGKCHC